MRLLLLVVLSVVAVGGWQPADASPPADAVVASLEPGKTEAEWRSLVSRDRPARQAQAACRPLRAVFYAATDWLRLATKLAAAASPCAEYYVFVPAIVGSRTQLRPNAAVRIRALGPNFHALAEIHFAAWSRWVAETGGSWHAAGVTARQRMAEAGYDVARGDTWALNELSTAVRRGDGNARANVREFLRGLYEGDGSRPTQGAALVVGVGQRTSDLTVYQNTLQNWLTDAAFWADMATYVADWSQEVYGDVRSVAVPGTPLSTRREYLNDYLQHVLVLARAGGEVTAPARAFLEGAHSPLANAAWQRDSAYGWTNVPVGQMAAYVSAQVNALRFFSATTAQPRDHWGFAWAPRNLAGLPDAEFAAQTGQLLDRLAAAIRDSGTVVEPENPGSGACGPPGQEALCLVDVSDARFNEGWRSFRVWTQAVLGFLTAPQTIVAGAPSGPITLALVTTSGGRVTTGPPRTVTLSSSSPQGTFSPSPAGPWAPTLTVTVGPGVDAAFYYRDTRAGSHTITAAAGGTTSGTQTVTVTAGPVATVTVTPASSTVRARAQRRLTAVGTDAFGNAANGAFVWNVVPAGLGAIAPGPRGTATFTARRLLGTGTVTASAGAISGTASVAVTSARLRIRSLAFRRAAGGLRLEVLAVDGARRPVSLAAVSIVVRRNGDRLVSGRVRTGPAGRALLRVPPARGCLVATVTRASAVGFLWDGRTPRARYCRR